MRHLIEELDQLQRKLLEMGGLVEAAIRLSVLCLTDPDSNHADAVFKGERRINVMEIQIDALATSLLALQQPMARDLRLIVSAVKINTDLERMGDLAVNIAERSLAFAGATGPGPHPDIPEMARLTESMVRNSLDALVRRDAKLAFSVLASDDRVDALRTSIHHDLVAMMQRDPDSVPPAVDLILIVRHLERIADHATNIAEDVLFLVKGIDVRHHQAEGDFDLNRATLFNS